MGEAMDGKQFRELDKRMRGIERRLDVLVELMQAQALHQGVEQQLINTLMATQDRDPLQAYFDQGWLGETAG